MFVQPIILQFIDIPQGYRFFISQGPRFPSNTMIAAPNRIIFRAQTFPEFIHENIGISTLFLYGTDQAKDYNVVYINPGNAQFNIIYNSLIKSIHWFNNVYANREIELSSSQGSPFFGGPEGPSGYSSSNMGTGDIGHVGVTGPTGPTIYSGYQ